MHLRFESCFVIQWMHECTQQQALRPGTLQQYFIVMHVQKRMPPSFAAMRATASLSWHMWDHKPWL